MVWWTSDLKLHVHTVLYTLYVFNQFSAEICLNINQLYHKMLLKLSLPLCITTQNTGMVFKRLPSVPTSWPPARTNSGGSLKRQLQSQFSSAEVWIMWNSTTHQPSSLHPPQQRRRRGASNQMLASTNTGGQRSLVDGGGPDHVALHQLEVNRPRPPLTLRGLN